MKSPGLDGAAMREARAELVGRRDLTGRTLAAALSAQADGWLAGLAGRLPAGWALAATGGYARGALCPGSDIDVMLLHPQRATDDQAKEIAARIWYPFWDAKLQLSPAVQSPRGALQLAADDLVTATSLLAVRHLAGNAETVAELRAGALQQWRKRPLPWLRRLLDATRQRWTQAGPASSLLEPNLKDGRGGLRDHDVLRWAVDTGRADVVASLEAPLADLDAAADLLLSVRCELHRATGRHSDVLTLQEQDVVAAAFGADLPMLFGNGAGRSDPADILMRSVSTSARSIEWAGERFWRRVERILDGVAAGGAGPRRVGRLERIVERGRRGRPSRPMPESMPGVELVGDELHLSEPVDPADPAVIFRLARLSARSGIPLSREALRQLQTMPAGDGDARWTEAMRTEFVALLAAGEPMIGVVEALEQYGLFSRLLPEWEHVRSLPQRNAFHTYNVDRHLLQTIANAAAFVRSVSRPDLLVVAALMHDLGKGHERDHSELGVELTRTIVPRMGFGPDDVETVATLVEHHLLLVETATRRDLNDPRTAANVADAVGTAERLDLLRALTESDATATGPAAWSNWKRALVDQLVWHVHRTLDGRPADPVDRDPDARFADLVDQIRFGGGVASEVDTEGELTVFRVAALDRAGLFATVAGTLAVHRVDIVTADAWGTSDGVAVQQFQIRPGNDPPFGRVQNDLAAVLAGTLDLDDRLAARVDDARRRARRRLTAAAAPRTEVVVSNEASDTTTMIDVRAPDGPAVLYRLASSLADQGVDIRSAKVATLGHEVVDVFYVQRPGAAGGQLPEDEHPALRAAVLAAVVGQNADHDD